MPGGDRTGPPKGGVLGSDRGIGRGRRGVGMNRGNQLGAGPTGECICPNCGATVSHQISLPCSTVNCPKCGTKMVRE